MISENPEAVANMSIGMSERTKTCFELLSFHPATIVHKSGVLWCPAAKTGSSSVSEALQLDRLLGSDSWASIVKAQDLSLEQKRSLCEKEQHVTFTMVRDPYDRLASAYLDKIVIDGGNLTDLGMGCVQVKKRLYETLRFPSFSEFITTLSEMPLEFHDPHTEPFSYRCGTDKYAYDIVGHLSSFDESMAQLFAAAPSLGTYQPVHAKDLGGHYLSEKENASVANFQLRSDVLFMHGSERVSYFYGADPETTSKVRNGWWKNDVLMFSDYAQYVSAEEGTS